MKKLLLIMAVIALIPPAAIVVEKLIRIVIVAAMVFFLRTACGYSHGWPDRMQSTPTPAVEANTARYHHHENEMEH